MPIISAKGVARWVQGSIPPKFLAYLVILCFEKRRPKKVLLLSPKKFGLATPLSNLAQTIRQYSFAVELRKLCPITSGVQRSSDARDDCLIGCPPTKF